MEYQESAESLKSRKEEKENLQNQCLGVISGKRCTTMLPRGKHFCDSCKKRNNLTSAAASKSAMKSSGRGHHKHSHIIGNI